MHVHTKDQVMKDLNTRREEGTEPLVIRDGVFSGLDFNKEDLRGLDVPHSNWFECKLIHANCDQMDARESQFNHVHIAWGSLDHTNFTKAELSHVTLAHATCRSMKASHMQVYASNLSHSNFSLATLDHCQFLGGEEEDSESKTDLSHANFQGATLISSHFSDLLAPGVDFRFALLRNTIFMGVHLFGSDFSYADLSNADLQHTSLEGVTLTHATLENTLFHCVEQLKAANLYTIQMALYRVLDRQERSRIIHYHQQLMTGEDPRLAVFFPLYPDDTQRPIHTLSPQQQDAVMVQRFSNPQRERKSHPVSLLMREWVETWFASQWEGEG